MKNLILLILLFLNFVSFSQNADSLAIEKFKLKIVSIDQTINTINKKLMVQDSLTNDLNSKINRIKQKSNSDMVVSVLSVLVALGLLIITFQNNRNSKSILQQQIDEQKKINRAQQRPIVDAYRSGWKEKTELIMINYGQGPAILKEIIFEKPGHEPARTISDLINIKKIDKDVWWDDKWNYSERDYYLYPQQMEKLYTVTKENLMTKYHKTSDEAEYIIEKVREARYGITFKIKYTDLISIDNTDSKKEYKTSIKIYDEKTSG